MEDLRTQHEELQRTREPRLTWQPDQDAAAAAPGWDSCLYSEAFLQNSQRFCHNISWARGFDIVTLTVLLAPPPTEALTLGRPVWCPQEVRELQTGRRPPVSLSEVTR